MPWKHRQRHRRVRPYGYERQAWPIDNPCFCCHEPFQSKLGRKRARREAKAEVKAQLDDMRGNE